MNRAWITRNGEGQFHGIAIQCPGCGDAHVVPVNWRPPGEAGLADSREARWEFNGDMQAPTISPSILCTSGHFADGRTECWCTYEARTGRPQPFQCVRCHSFVTGGKIQFLDDCSHALAGKTVDLPEVPSAAAA